MNNSIEKLYREHFPLSLVSIEMTGRNRLSVEFDILEVSTFNGFYSLLQRPIYSLEVIYFAFTILSAKDWELIKVLLDREVNKIISFDEVEEELKLRGLQVERLKLASINYGSPASFDFIGIGKVLEILRDTIKDLVWRGGYEKQLADTELKIKASEVSRANLERKKQKVEIQKAELEAEKVILELAEKKITLLEKVMDLELEDEYKHRLAVLLFPEFLSIATIPPSIKAISSKTDENNNLE